MNVAAKLAVVTGASGAIGSAIARRLARDGASVIVHYHTGRDEAVGADLSARTGPYDSIARIDPAFGGRFAGRLDILVNDAGTLEFDALVDITDESFDRVFAIDVRALFVLARGAARRMTRARSGRIERLLRDEVRGPRVDARVVARSRPASITVNCVAPALVQIEPYRTSGPVREALDRYSSVGRFGTPDDIADANGETLTVDGGWNAYKTPLAQVMDRAHSVHRRRNLLQTRFEL